MQVIDYHCYKNKSYGRKLLTPVYAGKDEETRTRWFCSGTWSGYSATECQEQLNACGWVNGSRPGK